MNEAIRQRIKFVVEHGELYPTEKPATRPLMVRLALAIILLQIVQFAVVVALHVGR